MPEYRAKQKEEQVVPIKPVVTGLLLILCLWSFYELQSHGALWAKTHAFSPPKFAFFSLNGQWDKMFGMMFWSTFAQANIWQFLGSCYFLWVFGSTLEPRLGNLRFLGVVLVCMFGGWWLLAHELGSQSANLFLGPGLLTSGIIGAYLVFFPEKKINPGGAIRYSHRIFHDEPRPSPAESFGISPWIIIGAFVAYQVLMHFMLGGTALRLDVIRVVPAIGTFLMGLATCLVLVMATTGSIGQNPLKSLAVKKYQQLRALDMTHDEAIDGAARLLSIPKEQVQKWVQKGGGPLPQS